MAARLEQWQERLRAHHTPLDYFWCLDSVESTMDEARAVMREVPLGRYGVVLAREQTRGRGRQGRSWISPRSGLYSTFIVPSQLAVSSYAGLSLAVGCSVRRAVSRCGVTILLKWPNDLYTRDGKKIGGILVDIVPQDTINYILVGIGVNIDASNLSDPGISSLQALGATELDPIDVAAGIAEEFVTCWQRFSCEGFSALQQQWLEGAYGVGMLFRVDLGSRAVEGVMRGVRSDGALLIDCGGRTEAVVSGHVIAIERSADGVDT